jgi:hypothetical protein
MKNKLKKLSLVAALVALAVPLGVRAQGYYPDRNNAIQLGVVSNIAAGTFSNFISTNIVSVTNVISVWTNDPGAFVFRTNIVNNTNVATASAFVGGQQSWPLTILLKSDSANSANFQVLAERSKDNSKWGLGTYHLIAQNGTTEVVWMTNLDTYGYPYMRLTHGSNANTSTAITTNVQAFWQQSQNARPAR